jgi:hypothetical protein
VRQFELLLGPSLSALNSLPGRVLLWCVAGAALAQLLIWQAGAGAAGRLSPIFAYLLAAFDGHGNLLLLAVVALAFFLRGRAGALQALERALARPWLVAAVAFPLLCLGSLVVYHNHPLSMDEYVAVFQAQAFASGRLAGAFPPELIDQLIPRVFQTHFFIVARASGEVSASYWPGFALLLSPFVALGIPWAANPAIGALTLPALHRLALEVSGSRAAATWAIAFTLASPAFVVNAMSFYSMPAHLLSNLLYALLLIRPTVARALLAGLIGSLALTLHNPVPHLLFSIGFFAWLCTRPRAGSLLAALAAGYAPLVLVLGVGWHGHLPGTARTADTAASAAATAAPSGGLLEAMAANLRSVLAFPDARIVLARLAGASKIWTWGAAVLVVLAALGFWRARRQAAAQLLAVALATTFLGYFLVRFDQGHGWGYRYLHSAWFVLPVFAGIALDSDSAARDADLRRMAAWAVVLSATLAMGLRLVQVDAFISRHLGQVPPLATPAHPARPEVIFVNIRAGFYMQDLIQNHPLLRTPRVTMVYEGAERTGALMNRHFPAYRRSEQGPWGELWTTRRDQAAN